MLTLTRNDGVEFVMQAYRELITNGNKASLIQKVRSLSEQHGRFARLFKKEGGRYEAVFSNHAGYLLGESVKHYFYQAQNLIFCEEFDDKQRVLLVVVRNDEVYLDAVIPKPNVQQELRLLIGDPYEYQIFTHGHVPLKETNNPNLGEASNFSLPKEKVKSFERISRALFPRLPTIESLQLLPLPAAIKAQRLQSSGNTLNYISITIIALAAGWFLFDIAQKLKLNHGKSLKTQAALNLPIHTKITRSDVLSTFHNIISTINTLYSLPGWQAEALLFEKNQYIIRLKSNGGSLSDLVQWCVIHHFSYTFSRNTLILKKNVHAQINNLRFTHTSQTNALGSIIHQLAPLLGETHIIVGNLQSTSREKPILLTLEIKNSTPKILDIIGQLIQNQPLTIQSALLKLDGINLNGQIQLNLWGHKQ